MRKRMNIVVVACLITMAALVWIVARAQQKGAAAVTSVPSALQAQTPVPVQIEIVQVPVAGPQPATVPTAAAVTSPTIATSDLSKHLAQPGESVGSLAADLLGKDSKTNRDAIISVNPALQNDPDKLLAGKTYRIPTPSEIAANEAAPVEVTPAAARIQPAVKPAAVVPTTKVLKYTALPGDTVGKMAAAFLGSDDQAQQDLIINANPTLKADPDHVEAGQSYRIPVPEGLSASAAPVAPTARPTTQPDADQVIAAGSPRELRYTARAGDTVSKMAIQLLGSDTAETRDLIIKNNPTLKKDPDRVIAGQTYWIPAPTASADAR